MTTRIPRAARGFSLLEVLIALLIFSLGLLGMAGLMVVSVKTNQSAYLRTQASFLAQGMVERIRANLGQVASYATDYSSATVGTDPCASGAVCTPVNIGVRDRALWSQQLVDQLPNPNASIRCDGGALGSGPQVGAAPYNGLCTFTIQWSEASLNRTSTTGAADAQTFAWVFRP